MSSREAQTSSPATLMEDAAPREEHGGRRVTMTRILLQLLPSRSPAFLFLSGNFFFSQGPGREIGFMYTRTRVEMSPFVAQKNLREIRFFFLLLLLLSKSRYQGRKRAGGGKKRESVKSSEENVMKSVEEMLKLGLRSEGWDGGFVLAWPG